MASTASYSKFVTREMSKAEALLKVILSPVDFVADTYCALKHGRGITQPAAIAPLVAPPATPAISPAMTASSAVGFIASREYALTRAAALGRGAATTGFKWFLAPTEADKDRKDGPFKKLFNT